MAQVCSLTTPCYGPDVAGERVNLNETRTKVHLRRKVEMNDHIWYLDTNASNHMTGCATIFSELDTTVHDTVKFGDNSIVDIKGRGTILFEFRNGEHRALTFVYFILRLKSNIVSLG